MNIQSDEFALTLEKDIQVSSREWKISPEEYADFALAELLLTKGSLDKNDEKWLEYESRRFGEKLVSSLLLISFVQFPYHGLPSKNNKTSGFQIWLHKSVNTASFNEETSETEKYEIYVNDVFDKYKLYGEEILNKLIIGENVFENKPLLEEYLKLLIDNESFPQWKEIYKSMLQFINNDYMDRSLLSKARTSRSLLLLSIDRIVDMVHVNGSILWYISNNFVEAVFMRELLQNSCGIEYAYTRAGKYMQNLFRQSFPDIIHRDWTKELVNDFNNIITNAKSTNDLDLLLIEFGLASGILTSRKVTQDKDVLKGLIGFRILEQIADGFYVKVAHVDSCLDLLFKGKGFSQLIRIGKYLAL